MQDTLSEEPTLSCRISQDRLRHVAESVGAIVDEAIIDIDAAGIHIDAVDPANVAMVSVDIHGEELRDYEAGVATVGVNISRLAQVLEHIPHTEPVTLAYNSNAVELELQAGAYEFVFGAKDPDALRNPPTLPDLPLDAELGVSALDLGDAVAYADQFGKHLLFEHDTGADTLHLRAANGGDTELINGDAASVTFNLHDEQIHADGDVWTLVSLDYLEDVVSALPHQSLTVQAGEEYPVEFSYELLGAAEPWLSCTYVIAPRVVDE